MVGEEPENYSGEKKVMRKRGLPGLFREITGDTIVAC